MNRTIAIAILSTTVTTLQAQQPARAPHAPELERHHAVEMELHTKLRAAVETRTTKGAPYSAEATTEFTQALGDGNRIVRKSVTRIYRDSEGRMRREPVATSAGPREGHSITISDPLAGTSVILDPETRTAYSAKPMVVALAKGQIEAELRRREEHLAEAGTVRMRTPAPDHVIGTKLRIAQTTVPGGDTTREDLGVQTIEGVSAQGTRTTTVIPAGAIGNEQPLTIVSEQWFSPDLQVLVMTRHSDPRAGETVYRLTNVVRAEPDRFLFEVPADYTVKDAEKKTPLPVLRKQ